MSSTLLKVMEKLTTGIPPVSTNIHHACTAGKRGSLKAVKYKRMHKI